MNDKSARANQYAQAVVQAMLDRWQSTLHRVATAAMENGQLAATLSDMNQSADVRMGALDSLLPADTPQELRNTLRLMAQAGDLALAQDVADALGQVASGQAAPTKAEVTSAVELSTVEQDQFRQTLAARYGDGLLLNFQVDPSLLGGLRVRVGDHLVDTSVATKLRSLREAMTAAVR